MANVELRRFPSSSHVRICKLQIVNVFLCHLSVSLYVGKARNTENVCNVSPLGKIKFKLASINFLDQHNLSHDSDRLAVQCHMFFLHELTG